MVNFLRNIMLNLGVFVWQRQWRCLLVVMSAFDLFYSGFFPVAINFLRRIPVIGTILNMPGISTVSRNALNRRKDLEKDYLQNVWIFDQSLSNASIMVYDCMRVFFNWVSVGFTFCMAFQMALYIGILKGFKVFSNWTKFTFSFLALSGRLLPGRSSAWSC